MKLKSTLRVVNGGCKCGLMLILFTYGAVSSAQPVAPTESGPVMPQPSTTVTASLSHTLSSDLSPMNVESVPAARPTNVPHPFTPGHTVTTTATSMVALPSIVPPTASISASATTTSSVVALPSIAPPTATISGTVTTTPSVVALPSIAPPTDPINGSSVTKATHTRPPITPPRPFFNTLEIILIASSGGVFILLLMILAFCICCCLCCRKTVIKVSSVAELCDLSHYTYDDLILTKSCRNNPTYANTMTATNDEGTSGATSDSKSNIGQASPTGTNAASTFDQNSQKVTNSADMNDSIDQSSQDEAGRHKIVKQMSTSSIQVSEDLDWGTVPTLSRGKGLFGRK